MLIDIITLIGVSLDLVSTVVLACMAGHCESNCCKGMFEFEHDDGTSQKSPYT